MRKGTSTKGITKRSRFDDRTKKVVEASLGNQWWRLRSKHGRDTLFKSPKLLWDAALEYFQHVEENPLKEVQLVSYQGITEQEEVPKQRPFTMKGLCLYLGCSESYFKVFKVTYGGKDKEAFLTVITQIEDTIYNQKFEGAAAGFFSTLIIARDLGLADKTETKVESTNVNITPTAEEAKKIRKALEKNI